MNLRLPGQYFDAETGLHYNLARYYDPGTGRYLQSDPIGLAGGINTYTYVGNDPVNLVDPLGLVGDDLMHSYGGHPGGVAETWIQWVQSVVAAVALAPQRYLERNQLIYPHLIGYL